MKEKDMQRPVKFLLVISVLGGLFVMPASAEARDRGGSHGGGSHNNGTIIFIPPEGDGNGGGDYSRGSDHMRDGGSSDSHIRHRDSLGSIGRDSGPSDSQEFINRKRQDLDGRKRDYISGPSDSQELIYRKRQGLKKPDGDYSSISKRRHADDSDHHKHKRHHKRHGKYQHYYAGWWYLDPWWTYGLAPYYADRLSCAEARRIVRQRYNRVKTIECRGRIYTFTAVDNRGRHVEVSVNSITGTYWRS